MLAVLRRFPQFRKLWLAQAVSQAGDWLNHIAVLALIGQLSGAAGALGMGALFGVELALRLLPTAFFGPLAGPLADRLPRRAMMIVSDLVRAGIVVCLLMVDEPGELPLLFALVLMQMSLGIFFDAARAGALPNTVDRESLHAAYALSAATWSATLALGAFLGGVALRHLGLAGVFLLDAASYLVSAAFLARLELPATPRQDEPFSWRNVLLATELRWAWGHLASVGALPVVWAKWFWGVAGGYLVLLSIAANVRFGTGPAPSGSGLDPDALASAGLAVGVLYCARGVGTGLGPILTRWWLSGADASLLVQTGASFLVAAAGYALLGFAGQLWVAFLCVTLAHMGGSTLWVSSTTLWQRRVSDAFRGRVHALEFLGTTLAFSTGGVLAGLVYDATAAFELTLWGTCAATVLSGALWWRTARRLLGTWAAGAGAGAA